MTLHAHIENNAHVPDCLVCRKEYKQVIEEAVKDYLHQTAESREAVKDRTLKRKAFLDVLQSGVFTFVYRGVPQATACDGQVLTVNYSNTQPGEQTILLPLFEDSKHCKIQFKVSDGHFPLFLKNTLYIHQKTYV